MCSDWHSSAVGTVEQGVALNKILNPEMKSKFFLDIQLPPREEFEYLDTAPPPLWAILGSHPMPTSYLKMVAS